MAQIVGPDTLVESYLHDPIIWPPDGWKFYGVVMQSGGRYGSFKQPMLRDANNQPTTLQEELAPGSVVRLRVHGDELVAVMIITAVWNDPFLAA
jgi:hypothetical protein